jgi:hypothetical protein
VSVAVRTIRPVDLTPAQRRTLEQLIGVGSLPPSDVTLADRVRSRLELRLVNAGILPGVGGPIWVGKHRLNDHQRCEGLFHSALLREGPGFEHSARTAAGALFHRAIELDVATERNLDPRTLCERAAGSLESGDGSFDRYWSSLDELDRALAVTDSGQQLELFRASFPPLTRRWAPQPELRLKAWLVGGRVVLSGTPDLVLGRTRRLVLDFKTGRAWPEHPEDMRFYALLLLLRTGVAPYRVATFFLDSGEWQAEDVTDETVEHAAGRVADAAIATVELSKGLPPTLRAGAHCEWCPRRTRCPAAAGWFGRSGSGKSSDAA